MTVFNTGANSALVPRQLLGGARVRRCHGLHEELALAFALVFALALAES
jgi:hypothetical protein